VPSARGAAVQDDNPQTDLTWTSAQRGWGRRPALIVGSLVLAASCVTAGFVIGRMTAKPMAGPITAQVQNGPIAAPSAVKLPAVPAPPHVVILNPGTADIGRQDGPDISPNSSVREASRLRTEVRNPETRDKGSPAAADRASGSGDGRDKGSAKERDYRALRDYVLSR
jgi:hypothetical protein